MSPAIAKSIVTLDWIIGVSGMIMAPLVRPCCLAKHVCHPVHSPGLIVRVAIHTIAWLARWRGTTVLATAAYRAAGTNCNGCAGWEAAVAVRYGTPGGFGRHAGTHHGRPRRRLGDQ